MDLLRESEKLPAFAFTEGTGVTAIRNHRWKLVHIDFEPVKEEFTGEAYQFWVAGDYEKPASIDEYGFMLFDLAEDPQESTDVKGEYPEVYERLKREYEEYQRDLERDFALGTTNAIDEVVVERLRSLGYVE